MLLNHIGGMLMNTIIGERIKEERTSMRLTQEELAERLNNKFDIKINKGMISKWENGREEPSLPNIRYLSAFFGVSMAYLVGDVNSRTLQEVNKPTTVAAHLPEGVELTEEEEEQLDDYIQFILSRRKQ